MPKFTGMAASTRCLARRVLLFLSGVALVLMQVSCVEPPSLPLAVGMNPWVGYDSLVLARERKLIDPHEVKVVELHSSAETLRQFSNGLLDAAAITLDEALRLAGEGEDIRIIAVFDESAGADVVMGNPQIRSLKDLKDRTIAVESSTAGSLMLKRLLQAAELSVNDVRVIDLDAVQHFAALRSGRLAAAVTYEPMAQKLRDSGYVDLFDSREMPGEIVDVLVVRNKVLTERPASVQSLLQGWIKGQLLLASDPVGSARILAPGVELSEREYLAVRSGLVFYNGTQALALLTSRPPKLAQDAERLVATLQEMGTLKESPDWGALIATEPLQAVLSGSAP